MYDLPEHLASLNTLAPAPANTPIDPSVEDEVWEYFNTDAFFQNFGVNPSEYDSKLIGATPTLTVKPDTIASATASTTNTVASSSATVPSILPQPPSNTASQTLPADLKSFIEQFASTARTIPNTDYANALALGLPMTASTTASVNPSDLLASSSTSPSDENRPSGAKKLKSIGAGQAEIEEE